MYKTTNHLISLEHTVPVYKHGVDFQRQLYLTKVVFTFLPLGSMSGLDNKKLVMIDRAPSSLSMMK